MEKLQERSSDLRQRVSELNSQLAVIDESLDEAAGRLTEKTNGEDGSGAQMPIIRLKEGIRTLQEELQQMHFTSAMLNHDLLQRRKEATFNKRTKVVSRKSTRNSKKNDGEHEDENLFDDL